MNTIYRLVVLVICLQLAACSTGPTLLNGDRQTTPKLNQSSLRMDDGVQLALSTWPAKNEQAVIIAVHGFNGYAGDFALPAPWLAQQGFTVYAYDQRGFGRNSKDSLGLWAGAERMAHDLIITSELVRARHRGKKLYILGFSMGGAVAMKAATQNLKADGLILAAPAIWGWQAMNPVYKSALWLTAHLTPTLSATGSGLEIWPSDNIDWLRRYSSDKLNIKETRFDTLYGLVTLMDEAWIAADKITQPVLYLYGAHDEIVPRGPSLATMKRITAQKQMMYYKNAWHMILQDKQRVAVYRDIKTWIGNHKAKLPSGENWKAK